MKAFGLCAEVTGEPLESFKQENNKIRFAFKKALWKMAGRQAA